MQVADGNGSAAAGRRHRAHGKKIERVHFWIAHPRKGCSCRLTVNNIKPADIPRIIAYVHEGRDRALDRLDPSLPVED